MIYVLDSHSPTGFKDLLTGGECWMAFNQTPTRIWAIDRSCVNEKVPPTIHSYKTMITVFGVDGIAL
jgi:hypothetical protein